MKNSIINLIFVSVFGLVVILGCSAPKETANGPAPSNTTAAATDKPMAVSAKNLTKTYDENELAANEKYKDKFLAVSGKVESIAETFGNVTVSLEGHNVVLTVLCSFEESEKASVAKLKKGQQATLVGKSDGLTAGLYVGLQKCKVQ